MMYVCCALEFSEYDHNLVGLGGKKKLRKSLEDIKGHECPWNNDNEYHVFHVHG